MKKLICIGLLLTSTCFAVEKDPVDYATDKELHQIACNLAGELNRALGKETTSDWQDYCDGVRPISQFRAEIRADQRKKKAARLAEIAASATH